MMHAYLQQAIVMAAAIIVLARAEPALNRMRRETPILLRISFHALAVGALAQIVAVISGEAPGWPAAIVIAGIAVLLLCERRMRALCPPMRRRRS